MAGSTPVYGFPYPTSTDSPAGHTQMQSLATAVENKFVTVDAAIAAALPGGEYHASTTQVMNASGATKINFGATIQAASGITWNGSNQFTVVTAGVYGFYASAALGFVSTTNWGVGVHDGTATPSGATPWFGSPLFGSGQTNSFTSGLKYFPAGQTLSAWFYNNEAVTRTINSGAVAVFRVWRLG